MHARVRLDPLGLTGRGNRPEPKGAIRLWVARLLFVLCEDVLEYLDLSQDIHILWIGCSSAGVEREPVKFWASCVVLWWELRSTSRQRCVVSKCMLLDYYDQNKIP